MGIEKLVPGFHTMQQFGIWRKGKQNDDVSLQEIGIMNGVEDGILIDQPIQRRGLDGRLVRESSNGWKPN
jgi:hypothetical protein